MSVLFELLAILLGGKELIRVSGIILYATRRSSSEHEYPVPLPTQPPAPLAPGHATPFGLEGMAAVEDPPEYGSSPVSAFHNRIAFSI